VVFGFISLKSSFKPAKTGISFSSLSGVNVSDARQKQSDKMSSLISQLRPLIIYGTAWKKSDTARFVEEAVSAGFRAVDTACQPKHYDEAGVGEGWTRAAERLGLTREDLYLQTKFTAVKGQDRNNIPYDESAELEDQVRQSLSVSLTNLRTSYLDALVLHSPLPDFDSTLRVWRAMEGFVDDGSVVSLGISNCYKLGTLRKLYEEARVKPSVLQNRFHAQTGFDKDLREFCTQKGMVYQSFWTLSANRHALRSGVIRNMAKSKDLTPQTLMYAYMMTNGHTPLSGTTNTKHMKEDVAIMERMGNIKEDKILTDKEMATMSEILGIS